MKNTSPMPEKAATGQADLENKMKSIVSSDGTHPNRVFDAAIAALGLTSDRALSRALGVPATVISKIRHGRLPLGPSMLLRLHEETGIGIRELKAM